MNTELIVGCIILLALLLGALAGYWTGEREGAIAAHKGEIVCAQLAFKEERWECGEL